jgi:ABC-type lipoprotein release transport system permease subunit
MRAIGHLVTHQLLAAWRGWAALVLLIGFAAGVVLAAAAGAQRTDSAYLRFLEASKASDVLVSPVNTGLTGYYGALSQLRDVSAVAPIAGLLAAPIGPGGVPDFSAAVAAPVDGRWGHLLEVPKLLAGRLPAAGRPGEIAVDQIGAADLHLHAGSRLVLGAGAGNAPPTRANVRRLRVRVVGIVVLRGSVVPVTVLDHEPMLLASTALFHLLGMRYRGFDGAFVKLRPGTTAGAFGREAQALTRRYPGTQGHVFVADEAAQAATIERAIRPSAIALTIFALVLAVTAVLVIGQVAARLLFAASADNPVLSALGMTRRELTAAALMEVGLAATAGALLAVGVAVAASPLMPIGPARLAEPDPGVNVNVPVLTVGAVVTVALLVARVAWPAWRLASAGHGERGPAGVVSRRPLLAQWAARAGATVTATVGVRLALEPGRGRTAVPVRGALAGTALSIAAVAAAFTFGANLVHLVGTPSLYGKTWDVAVDLQFSTVTPQVAARFLGRVPGVTGWTFGDFGTVGIGGNLVPAIGVAGGRGPLMSVTMLAGHLPSGPGQVVLGSSVLHRFGLRVGQSVPITISNRRQIARITGRAVFPNFGQGSFTPTDLGQGAETVASVLTGAGTGSGAANPGYNFVLVRFAAGPRHRADIAAFGRSMAAFCARAGQSRCVVRDQRPNGVASYARIDGTPEVLAGVLAVFGLAVLGQLIVLSGRRHRRDFAILKALGLLRRQVSLITAWQVTTLTGLSLLVGVPLGIAAGRWTWALFAQGLGIPAVAITPVSLAVLTAATAMLLANAIAFWPGHTTSRLSPAEILRTE